MSHSPTNPKLSTMVLITTRPHRAMNLAAIKRHHCPPRRSSAEPDMNTSTNNRGAERVDHPSVLDPAEIESPILARLKISTPLKKIVRLPPSPARDTSRSPPGQRRTRPRRSSER
jgi:hypothetical protein